MPLEKLKLLQPTLEHHWRDCDSPHKPRHIYLSMQSSIHASLKWQDGGTPVSKWTGLCIFCFYLEFTALLWIPVLLLTHVSTSTSLCAYLWYEHHYSFCVFGVASQMKSVEFKQLPPYQLYTQGVACWEVTWPNDLQTRFCQYTGIPLDRPHWKTTGATSTLGCHWNHTIAQIGPLSFQAAIEHKPKQVRWGGLHAPVVTEWWPACLHKQFPRVHHRGN